MMNDIIYMDYNATTPVAPEVVRKITDSLQNVWANPSSSYPEGIAAKTALQSAREDIALLLNCEADNIVFTSGGTEANNMVIFSTVSKYKSRIQENLYPDGDLKNSNPHVITTDIEHDSVILPLKKLKEDGFVELTEVSAKNGGMVSAGDVVAAIRPNTCLITVMLANNETGIIQPVEEIAKCLKKINAERANICLPQILLHTDAAQGIGKISVNFETLNVDYLTVVGHKFYGPRIGALVAKDKKSLQPLLYGGGQEEGIRPGTENVAMAVGLGEAARLAHKLLPELTSKMQQVRDHLEQRLEETFGNMVEFNCRPKDTSLRLPNTCSVSVCRQGMTGPAILAECPWLRASTGSACHALGQLSGVLIASGVARQKACCTLRLSIGRETTQHDVETVVEQLRQAVKRLETNVVK
ncbi:selenocysteine lyase-like isoform X2 [Schistocerca serialis cubense]|uniref:selenocysteine lyase-like isoform X2 n=1 Tax=Schistocerca serialis cubense TaxID=2023355 RepID=UPI00214F43B8|nr:selenocysteine lyase-like isoform X2 [Schistocerca serialis cubense]